MSPRLACGAIVALTIVLLGSTSFSQDERKSREFFPNTKDRGRAAVEFEDATLHVVAAYYYSQRNHDSRWILIEVAVTSDPGMRVDREDFHLLDPNDRRIELATQSTWWQDHRRVRLLLQRARTTRHGIGAYFTQRDSQNFRFFVLPGGLSYDFFDANPNNIGWGDLFFASPTGAWSRGTHTLVLEVTERDARAALPIDLD